MSKPLDTAPGLPGGGCVDFNKLHAQVIKGNENAVADALIVPDAEKAPADLSTEIPAPKND